MIPERVLLDALFECPHTYVVLVQEGAIQRVNAAAAALVGRPAERLVGEPVTAIIAPEDCDIVSRTIGTLAGDGEWKRCLVRVVADDGSRHTVEWGVHRVAHEDATAILAVGHDLTERVRLEEHLRERTRALEEANRALSERSDSLRRVERELAEKQATLAVATRDLQLLDNLKANLISTVSHELRTPLVSVRGYADMLSAGRLGPLTEAQQQAVEVMLRNIDRLMEIIENVVIYSALENQEAAFQPQVVNLNVLLTSALRLHEQGARKRDLTLDIDFGGETFLLPGDPQHLATLFQQLIGNAVKFNTAGGRVNIRVRRAKSGVEIEIADTGIGIPADRLSQIFERFYQVDSGRTRRYGGLGLGLSIVRHIVLLHGGTISVDSRPGEGTSFTVWLPEKLPG